MNFTSALKSLSERKYMIREKWKSEDKGRFDKAQKDGNLAGQTFEYEGRCITIVPGHKSIIQITPGAQASIAHWLPLAEDFNAEDWEVL